MPLWHGKGAKAVKFTFELSDVAVHLNSASSVAVAVDNVSLTWERGRRSVSRAGARVVEKLDQLTGSLSRTAPLLGSEQLLLPCTLFRFGGNGSDDDGGRWGSKPSEFKIFDADAEADEALLCVVTFELSSHAASSAEPVHRTRVELPLSGDLGSLSFALCSRLISGSAADDGASNAGSDGCSNADILDPRALDDATAEAAATHAASSSAHGSHEPAALGHRQMAENSAEARWQEMYELERSKADALTIESLHKDLSDLIRDKQRLSEDNLRLRSMVTSSQQPKRLLMERIAELEADVARMKKEATANEERQATAFNSVIRSLEEEVANVTTQRDEAQRAAEAATAHRRRMSALKLHAASLNGSQSSGLGLAHQSSQPSLPPPQRSPAHGHADEQRHQPDASAMPSATGADSADAAKAKGRKGSVVSLVSLRRTLSFEGKSTRSSAAPAAEPKQDEAKDRKSFTRRPSFGRSKAKDSKAPPSPSDPRKEAREQG